jgi:tetratricopeptide (TPR) repeat protein
LLWQIAATNAIYYLHPSFGYFFELLYLQPHGLVYKLESYPTNALVLPPLSKEIVDENEAYWARVKEAEIKPLLAALHPPNVHAGFMGGLMDLVHLEPIVNRDLTTLASLYSRALDYWGVEMQKQRRLKEAEEHFGTALELNPDNIVARVNLDCNKNLQAGKKPTGESYKSIEDQFGKYRNWEDVMNENGPFDDPGFCFEQGRLHARFQLNRQAAAQFERAMELVPSHIPARLWLAQIYILSYMPDEALKLINEIHAAPQTFSVHKTNRTEMLYVEASAYLAKDDLKGAEESVKAMLNKNPEDEDLLATAAHVYMQNRRFTNALTVIERELKLSPDNPGLLVNKGYAYIQLNAFEEAIPPLTRALTLETNNTSALLNRAIAYLRSEKYAESQHDYEALQKLFPTAFQVYYGLAEIAYRKKDTNAAIRNYQLYLANSPGTNEETTFVRNRLKELKPASP